eukprot:5799540-Karenia_brevis.AAC.1
MIQKTGALEGRVDQLAQTLGTTVQASVEQRVQSTCDKLKEDLAIAAMGRQDEIVALVKDNHEIQTAA